ncbi:MAG: hypothetical protein A2Z32_06750 [Chloroflexi bacterium RBG_16_69_14]|nr:MAG: hypothetical protein A2Z32_06750 [Chloroflexi bacterium RBG_16_69_14]
MERDTNGGSDSGRDYERALGDEPSPAIRDSPPDYLAPIDASAPVSGHTPAPEPTTSPAEAPEQDWTRARDLLYPAFRPVGTQGLALESIDRETLAARATQSHAQPLLDVGPAGLPVVYTISAGAYDIVVNGDHLLSWGVEPSEIQDAAMRNLAAWSATAPWTDEVSGDRRLISSDTGNGWDAVRILLPDVSAHLTAELGGVGRILIGLPERHLLTAGSLRPGDDDFATLFAEFLVEHSGGADEPIDRRVFELVDGRLVEFAGVHPTA